jgi:hypothetical protein
MKKLDKLDSIFSSLSEGERIEALRYLTRLRVDGDLREESETVLSHSCATVPTPSGFESDYGRGFVTIDLSLRRGYDEDHSPDDNNCWVAVSIRPIDDGSVVFYGPHEHKGKAQHRRLQAEGVLQKHYGESGGSGNRTTPSLADLKEDLQDVGLHTPDT